MNVRVSFFGNFFLVFDFVTTFFLKSLILYCEGAPIVRVNLVENGLGEPISKPGPDCLRFSALMTTGKA